MAVAAGGVDAVVFTGGIGENSNVIREKVLAYCEFLGLKADHERNLAARFGLHHRRKQPCGWRSHPH